jgi:hypothetical protein
MESVKDGTGPEINLRVYHGVLAPHARGRPRVAFNDCARLEHLCRYLL